MSIAHGTDFAGLAMWECHNEPGVPVCVVGEATYELDGEAGGLSVGLYRKSGHIIGVTVHDEAGELVAAAGLVPVEFNGRA